VKFFHDQKEYGFIEREDGEDVFFHISDVEEFTPEEEQEVEFKVTEGEKGPRAENVRKA